MAPASQSNGAETSEAAASPAVSQTVETRGISHTPTADHSLTQNREGLVGGGQTCWPTSQKKLINVTLAPQMTAAPQETRTPIFPRPARCGLEELAPKPHTIAETINAKTDRMRPMVMTAPTMVRSWAMPGRPESLGLMSTCIGNSGPRAVAVSTARIRVLIVGVLLHREAEGSRRSGAPPAPHRQSR